MESLQEQLIKAGLVNKNKAHKVKKDKQKQARSARGNAGKTDHGPASAAQQQQARRAEHDRELNRQRQIQADQKAVAAQVRQLIELNRLNRAQAEIAYSFVYRNKVKKIFVSSEMKQQLSNGRLAIVRLVLPNDTLFEIVPAAVAQKIAERDEHALVVLISDTGKQGSEDDPYADYQIPDDLSW